MADQEGTPDRPEEIVEEPKGDSADVTEHLRVKLSSINNELQNTMKIVDNYKEDKRVAEKQKNELEESKKEILVLKRRLSDSESNCKRYRNERNDLRRDIARLIQDRKQMISYEEDVQQLKRDIEMQKNKYTRNNNEWKTKYDEVENKYEELIKEQKLKIESAEQEVQQLTKDLELQKETSEQEKMTLASNQPEDEETNLDTEIQQDDDQNPDEEEDDPEHSHVKIKKRKKYSVHKTKEHDAESEVPEPQEDNTAHVEGDQNDTSEVVTEEPQNEPEDSEVIEKTTGKNKEMDAKPEPKDVCDANGPKIIAEKYEALYDSKWTSAYRHISQYFDNEEETVEALLEILQDIMNFCKQKAQGQIDDIYRILTFSSDQDDDKISDTITKHLKECMREMSSVAKEYLYELYLSDHDKKSSQHLQFVIGIETFVKECFELCWLMVIQDPPVVFHPLPKESDAYDMEIYKPYKSAGPYVNFVVLPALLLHEAGPVLAVGVAECGNEKSSRQKQRLSYKRRFMSKSVKDGSHDETRFDSRDRYLKRDISDFVYRHESYREIQRAKDETDFGDIDRVTSNKGTKVFDKDDFDVHDQRDSCARRDFATHDDFDYHNSSHIGSRNEADLRENDRLVSHDEIRVGHKGDFVSKDQRDSPRFRRQLHATDETAYQDSSHVTSRHETELDNKHRIELQDDIKLGIATKGDRDVRFKHDFDSKDGLHFLDKDPLVARNETNFDDKNDRGEFFSNEREDPRGRTGSAFRKTYVGGRDDFVQRDERDFRRREDIEMTSRHGENYPHVQLYHGHTRSTYENNSYANTETDMYNFIDETGPAYSQSTILTKARGTANVWKPSYGYERDPTPDEMRLYFQYIDRHDHTGARDVLGHAAYTRCRRRDHNKHMYL